MLTVAALVKNEDDLKNDGDVSMSPDTDVTAQRANVVRAANDIRNNLAMGGSADATLIRAQDTFLASDFEMYAKNRQTVFSLSEALLVTRTRVVQPDQSGTESVRACGLRRHDQCFQTSEAEDPSSH